MKAPEQQVQFQNEFAEMFITITSSIIAQLLSKRATIALDKNLLKPTLEPLV